jgi:hypothetical protein
MPTRSLGLHALPFWLPFWLLFLGHRTLYVTGSSAGKCGSAYAPEP